MRYQSNAFWPLCGLVCCIASQAILQPAKCDEKADREKHFEQAIRPVLASKCVQCHGEKKQEGGLRLDSLAALLQGGDSGQTVVPGESQKSLLMEAIKYESYEMPPTGQLSQNAIAEFEKWISGGAHWPSHTEALRAETGFVTDEDRQWWAFVPVHKPSIPDVADDAWPQNEIDRFVLSKLEEKDMRPAPKASTLTMLRRVYFDLVGMPPTPEEIARFVNDQQPEAWERLIDELLSDRRYGEHWARFWLDLVRYSESDGWNQDAYRPHIWRYRDYVVDAFNTDKPYPDFVREQLAGDEMAGTRPDDLPEHLIAPGFLRLGIYEYNQRDARNLWSDILNEVTDVTGDVFLGLSMSCCRCHDHKFDPLPQKDYYKLRAFFEPLIWRDDLVAATPSEQQKYDSQLALWNEATTDLRGKIDALLKPYHDRKWKSTAEKFPLDIQACFYKPASERTSWEEQMAYLVSRQFEEEGGGPLKSIKKEDKELLERLQAELSAFDELRPVPLPPVMTAMDHPGPISPTTIPDTPSDLPSIAPGFLSVMTPASEGSLSRKRLSPRWVSTNTLRQGTTGRRTKLANWIGSGDNPLTMRVMVNRVWQQHFGVGLVATSSDFGRNGSQPTHPQLLDWLAATFVEQGFSLKYLHKQILLSSVWQQSAHHPQAEEYQQMDPSESLYWRARIRRLQAEQIRDAMLSCSGRLDGSIGGPSVDEAKPRRALYVKSFRNQTESFLHSFDMANGLKSVPQRDSTTTPTQALMLINGDYALTLAKAMAEKLLADAGDVPELARSEDTSVRMIVSEAIERTWGRVPSEFELERALDFVSSHGDLPDFCHVLFNSSEFLYIE